MKKQTKKSDNAKAWISEALTDLVIGIILLLIEKLLN